MQRLYLVLVITLFSAVVNLTDCFAIPTYGIKQQESPGHSAPHEFLDKRGITTPHRRVSIKSKMAKVHEKTGVHSIESSPTNDDHVAPHEGRPDSLSAKARQHRQNASRIVQSHDKLRDTFVDPSMRLGARAVDHSVEALKHAKKAIHGSQVEGEQVNRLGATASVVNHGLRAAATGAVGIAAFGAAMPLEFANVIVHGTAAHIEGFKMDGYRAAHHLNVSPLTHEHAKKAAHLSKQVKECTTAACGEVAHLAKAMIKEKQD
jgi:hypothetical protein